MRVISSTACTGLIAAGNQEVDDKRLDSGSDHPLLQIDRVIGTFLEMSELDSALRAALAL